MHKLVWAYGVIRPTSSPKLGIAASAAASLFCWWWRSVKGARTIGGQGGEVDGVVFLL
jgi:hypothetical protein